MFFLRYLGSEMRSRSRQVLAVALGLALGVGLVITVSAASRGVSDAQGGVLEGLYGVGTDVTVTKAPPPPSSPRPGNGSAGGMIMTMGPDGQPQVCVSGHCSTGAQTIATLTSSAYAPLNYSDAAAVGKLHDVKAVGAGLLLTNRMTNIPAHMGAGGGLPSSDSFDVDGVDFVHSSLGPLSDGTVTSGHGFTASDADSDVAVIDADYATASNLKVGSAITVAKTRFTVIGLVAQPQGAKPPDVYIPLARAQALGSFQGNALTSEVNAMYVNAASAADIAAVSKEISGLLPSATVTTPSSLANQVTGSLASTANLADDLGRWLSVLVLAAAFAVAALLTVASVGRRVREFGTLKAIGWRSGRIVAQVMGEAVVMGVIGAAAGIGLGFAGAAVIGAIAPKLSATVPTASGQRLMIGGPGGTQSSSPTVDHTVPVLLHPSVTVGVIALAVVLALAGGLVAGMAGSYRIRLRLADALTRVA